MTPIEHANALDAVFEGAGLNAYAREAPEGEIYVYCKSHPAPRIERERIKHVVRGAGYHIKSFRSERGFIRARYRVQPPALASE